MGSSFLRPRRRPSQSTLVEIFCPCFRIDALPSGFNFNVPQWWAIASWTSEQDNLHLRAIGLLEIVDGFDEVSDRIQVVFAVESSSSFNVLLDEVIDPAQSGSVLTVSNDFSNNSFLLDNGDRFLLAARYVDTPTISPNINTYSEVFDSGLVFLVIPEPSSMFLASLAGLLFCSRRR